jgi:hypothetical protein|tara:strand:+ start:1049 stop:1237 length:189 start_codon:yes stop_codon:yes gene_type:complete
MNIVSAKYVHESLMEKNCSINLVVSITGNTKTICVPIDETNTHYKEIKRQVDAGTLTIADAE